MAVTEQAASFGNGLCTLRTQFDIVTNSVVGFDWDNTGGGDGMITVVNPPSADQTIPVPAGSVDASLLATPIVAVGSFQIFFSWGTP